MKPRQTLPLRHPLPAFDYNSLAAHVESMRTTFLRFMYVMHSPLAGQAASVVDQWYARLKLPDQAEGAHEAPKPNVRNHR